MSNEPAEPAGSLVQELLNERRALKVALERVRLELEEARGSAASPDPRIAELQAEVRRLRNQVDDTRAEVNLLRTERDELRQGILQALSQLREEAT
jgi:chromosome segregation ATPase